MGSYEYRSKRTDWLDDIKFVAEKLPASTKYGDADYVSLLICRFVKRKD